MLYGNNWVFVENPKTATMSVARRLKEIGCESTGIKHQTLMASDMATKEWRFVIVRNPFDRMVSGWSYNTKQKDTSFEEWLTGDKWECGVGLDAKRCPQTCWTWGCNHILKYEELDDRWSKWMQFLGFDDRPLDMVNKSSRRPDDYREVYNSLTRQIVADRFANDLRLWGYEF